MAGSEPDLDVAVFGATGVTGRQVAAYLAKRAAETGSRWAAVGRDPAKLRGTLYELGLSGVETIAADLANPASLAAMARRARVVLNLVGPYTTRARPVIDACVSERAHYADLTGEIPFAREVVDEYDDRAGDSGVKLVQVCGFEALPPDLCVTLAAESARERWSEELSEVDVSVSVTGLPGLPRASDLISGGTYQSMAEAVGAAQSRRLADPAALVPGPDLGAAIRRRSPIGLRPRRDRDGAVIAPMTPAAFINPAVIHRTAALSAIGRGVDPVPFRYREGVAISGPPVSLPLRLGAAAALSCTQLTFRAISNAPPGVRDRAAAALRRALPGSGFGPAADRLEPWRWRLDVAATTSGSHVVAVSLTAEGHPGYLATARMLGEAGLMLAEPGLTPDRAGCLTPALALGTAAIGRFEAAGMRFAVH